MSRRGLLWRPGAVALTLGATLLLLGGCGEEETAAGRPLSVQVDSTPRPAALRLSRGIPILTSRQEALRHQTIVYSVPVGSIPASRRIRVAASVAPSYCIGSDINGTDRKHSPCRALADDHTPNPHYRVSLEARLYLQGGSKRLEDDAEPLGRARAVCTFDRHHCPLGPKASTTLGPGAARHVVVAIGAWTRSREWHPPDRMDLDCFAVGERCRALATNAPDPAARARILEHGQLSLIELDSNAERRRTSARSGRVDELDVPVNAGNLARRSVVHSARLEHVRPGDVVEVDGVADIGGKGFDHFAGSYWILARDPTTTRADLDSPDRYLSGFNGTNCLGNGGVLTDTASGYCSADRDPPTLPVRALGAGEVPHGVPSTIYLNYVASASDQSVAPGTEPSANVDSLRVRIACTAATERRRGCSIARP